ncbi:MAG TPA: HNH endonuclease signature motif containing protein [Stenomitos sp.]
MQDDLEKLVASLIEDLDTPRLKKHRDKKARIDQYYSPRQIFNRWRDSDEGKEWKQQQYEVIKGICPGCNEYFSIKHLEIDHIQPISQAPKLATDLKNLRLLCPPCNKSGANNDSSP